MVSNIILYIVARKKVNIGNVLYVSSLNTKRQRYTQYRKNKQREGKPDNELQRRKDCIPRSEMNKRETVTKLNSHRDIVNNDDF